MSGPIITQNNDLSAPMVATPNQAIQRLQISRATLYELINNGDLESYTEGRSRRILVQSMDHYIQRRLRLSSRSLRVSNRGWRRWRPI
jgi:excisionase family DNA binding protein